MIKFTRIGFFLACFSSPWIILDVSMPVFCFNSSKIFVVSGDKLMVMDFLLVMFPLLSRKLYDKNF